MLLLCRIQTKVKMAAASASAESNAAELLHMGKLANGKSVNTEASSVLSTSRMLAGCLLTQAECLALLQSEI